METEVIVDWMARNPWMLFLAIAILPGLGVPNCPMLILCGTAMTAAFGVRDAVTLAVGAVIVNILWTWWVAAFPFRDFLRKKIEKRLGRDFEDRFQIRERSVLWVTFLLHVTPGVPLFIQNYFPGVQRLAYWKYLVIAIPIQSLYTALIVGTSGQIFTALRAYPLVLLFVCLGIWSLIAYRRHHRTSRTKSPAESI